MPEKFKLGHYPRVFSKGKTSKRQPGKPRANCPDRTVLQRGTYTVKLISLNVGRPHLMVYKGVTINTGIFKKPVSGRIALRRLNLDGDRQADLSVHGGLNKAVYGYPSEHYEYWRQDLLGTNLPWGGFGENFTTQGLGEDNLHVGDRFRV